MVRIGQVQPFWSVASSRFYNCSVVAEPGAKWRELHGRPDFPLGLASVTIGVVALCLYLFCLPALYIQTKTNTCYKIMFALAIVDSLEVCVCAIGTGLLQMHGDVFCSNPLMNYAVGVLAQVLWCGSCMTCLLLALNRLFSLTRRNTTLLKGNRAWLILLVPAAYSIYFGFFTPPPLFNSAHGAWFFDPFIQDSEDGIEYENFSHLVNNLGLVLTICGLYIAIGVLLCQQRTGAAKNSRGTHATTQNFFIQTSLICTTNLLAALIYVYMNFFPATPQLIIAAQFFWELGHAFPAFIYVLLNKTVRRNIKTSLPFASTSMKVKEGAVGPATISLRTL